MDFDSNKRNPIHLNPVLYIFRMSCVVPWSSYRQIINKNLSCFKAPLFLVWSRAVHSRVHLDFWSSLNFSVLPLWHSYFLDETGNIHTLKVSPSLSRSFGIRQVWVASTLDLGFRDGKWYSAWCLYNNTNVLWTIPGFFLSMLSLQQSNCNVTKNNTREKLTFAPSIATSLVLRP